MVGLLALGFEPRLLSITTNDEALRDHGYVPVGSPFLPSWGLSGRIEQPSGLTTGFAMSYGFALRAGDPVPTTTTLVLLGGGPGHVLGPAHVGVHAGFANVGHTVGSATGGGALVYLGPYLEPRLSLGLLDGPGVVEVSLAGLLEVPVGPAHHNALWEEPFRRAVLGGASVALVGGLGTEAR